MYLFFLVVHVFVCFFLVAVILLQAGKGGGMTETLGGNITQSILGTRSTAFMTKLTAVCASLFLITCLALTYVSNQRRSSIFRGHMSHMVTKPVQLPTTPLSKPTSSQQPTVSVPVSPSPSASTTETSTTETEPPSPTAKP